MGLVGRGTGVECWGVWGDGCWLGRAIGKNVLGKGWRRGKMEG